MKRLAALQDWPVLSTRAATAFSTAVSRSSVLSRMNGSEPPSSSTTFLRLRPAISATAAPARSEPVSETPLHARILDHRRDLVVGRVDVDVRVRREAGLLVDLLHRLGRLRALGRVLEQDRVADRQVRAREARHLVVGEVPRHDPQQDALGAAADDRRAVAVEQLDLLVGQQLGRVVGVVLVDRGAEVELAQRLLDRLAHLAHDDVGEPLALLGVELADAAHERRALLHRRGGAPLPVCRVRAADRIAQSVVGDRLVLLDGLSGGRVHDGVVAHGFSLDRGTGCCGAS